MTDATPAPHLNRAGRRAESRRLRKTGAVMAAIPAAFGTTALLLGATALPAGAATLTVTNLTDNDPGSLRDRLAAASDGDTITFAPGLSGTIELDGDDLDVEDSVTILGPGRDLVTIDGNDKSRIFDLDQAAAKSLTVSISGLTLTDGAAIAASPENNEGGAIRANGGENLTLEGVTISSSRADDEGGAFVNYYETSSITVIDSAITGNTSGDAGGALYTQGDIEIRGSVISGNTADGCGGGVYLDSNSAGDNTVTIVGSVISGNRALYGGGLWVDEGAGVTIQGSTFTDNHVEGGKSTNSGGAISISDVEGPVLIESSTLSGNTASDNGGGMVVYYAASLQIVGSTIAGNTADNGVGGGLFLEALDGEALIANSTISGNSSGGTGGGIAFSEVAQLELINTTVTANTGSEVGGIASTATSGTGTAEVRGREDKVDAVETRVGVAAVGPHTLVGTIVWGNQGADLGGNDAVAFESTSSLLGTTDANATVTDVGGTLTGVDPLLGPLQDNGGPTPTHALLDGSPAVNAGEDPLADFPGNEWDQRGPGYPRVVGGRVDIGAFEVQPAQIEPNFTG